MNIATMMTAEHRKLHRIDLQAAAVGAGSVVVEWITGIPWFVALVILAIAAAVWATRMTQFQQVLRFTFFYAAASTCVEMARVVLHTRALDVLLVTGVTVYIMTAIMAFSVLAIGFVVAHHKTLKNRFLS